MLTEQGVLDRRNSYPCCMLGFLHTAVLAWDRGETHCGDENYEKALYMLWASRIMCDTPIESDTDPGCTSNEIASQWAKHADCLCAPCECEDPAVDCTLVPDYTVLEGLAYSDLPPSPGVDDSYYILSGTNVGTIATVGSITYVFTSIPDDTIVFASDTNTYYTNIGNGPGLLFSYPILVNVTTGWWVLTLSDPQTASGRTIQLQGLGPNGWYNLDIERTEPGANPTINLTNLPFDSVRLKYTLDNGCVYYSANGSFVPPIVPPVPCDIIPDFSVTATADASQEGSLPVGRYLIVSNEYGVSNEWSANVGNVAETATVPNTYTATAVGDIIYDISQDVYWQITSAGVAPLFIPVTMTAGIGQYLIESDYPAQSAVGTRTVTIIGLVDGNPIIFWTGYEYDLPISVPMFGLITGGVTVTYNYPSGCNYTVDGTVVNDDPIIYEFECGEPIPLQYRYGATTQGFTLIAPAGEVVNLLFAAGEMSVGTTIAAYSGTDNTGDPIISLTGSFADLTGVTGQSTGNTMYIEVTPDAAMPDNLATWLMWVSCIQTTMSGYAAAVDDCSTYQFNVSAEVTFIGDATSFSFSVSVNNGAPIIFGPYYVEDIYDLGDYPYDAQVSVVLVHDQDPGQSLWLGIMTNNGTCPDDPCAPVPDFFVRLEECSVMPVDGSSTVGINFLLTETGCPFLSFNASDIITWDVGTAQWILAPVPVGSLVLGDDGTYYVVVAPGVEIPYFQLTEAQPTGSSPLNWQFEMPAIQQYGLTSNRPVAIQVSLDGVAWTTVWTGTEQQLNGNPGPLAISIFIPFTQIRTVWFWDTCGYIGPVQLLG